MSDADLPLGPHIAIYGPAGSGKTTVSRALAARLALPVVELDAYFHDKPDWQDATREAFRAKVTAFLAEHPTGWVTDGNYTKMVADLVLAEADTAIWLQLPFRVVYPRLVWRTLRRAVSHELLWGTNRERWRDVLGKDSMLVWGIRTWRTNRRSVRALLRGRDARVRLIVLRTPAEVEQLLARASLPPVG